MNWILLSLLSAVSESAKDVTAKISANKTNEYITAIALHLISFVISLPLTLYFGIPSLKTSFWVGSFAFLFITPIWSILYAKAVKISDLSTTAPMMAFNPICTALLGFIFKSQTPTLTGWLGIITISLGIYLQNFTKSQKNLLSPLMKIGKDKGAMYMLFVAILWSLGAHFSKLRVDGSTALFSTFTGSLIGVITGSVLLKIKRVPLSLNTLPKTIKQSIPVGIFYYLATVLSSMALNTGSAAYVFSLKRSSLISSSLMGKWVFKENITTQKGIGLAVIFLGIILISL